MGRQSNEPDPRVQHMTADEQRTGQVPGDRGVFEDDRTGVHEALGVGGVGAYDDGPGSRAA